VVEVLMGMQWFSSGLWPESPNGGINALSCVLASMH
jgi:hypothetical protein